MYPKCNVQHGPYCGHNYTVAVFFTNSVSCSTSNTLPYMSEAGYLRQFCHYNYIGWADVYIQLPQTLIRIALQAKACSADLT